VIDGDSVDGTTDVIQSNEDLISNWVSEPDNGIYDAWNKACKLIHGKWVIFLGAGDIFFSSETLKIMNLELSNLPKHFIFAYGNVYQFEQEKLIYKYGQVNFDNWDDYRPQLPAHQGIFHCASIFIGSKPFDETYRVIADCKLLLPIINNENTLYFDVDICKMQPCGVSSRDDKAFFVMNEFIRLEKDLGYRIPAIKKYRYIVITLIKTILVKINALRLLVLIRIAKRKFIKYRHR
jgi:glycosyltransferase involved in cell wall biosynthesis